MSVGANIKQLRKSHRLTQDELAEKLNVARSTVTQWENGWSNPRMGTVQRLAGVFGVSAADIVSERGPQQGAIPSYALPVHGASATVPVRVLGRTHADEPMDEEECDYSVELPESIVNNHPRAFALLVEGDCMDRRFPPGCHVLVDPDTPPTNGCVAVVEVGPGEAVLRVWMRGSTTLLLAADSHADHEDVVITPEHEGVRCVGVAVWFQAAGELV